MDSRGNPSRPPSGIGRSHRARLIGALACALQLGHAQAQENSSVCGPLHLRHYGPYDYRTQRDKIEIVDRYHFTPRVEALVHGESTDLGGDINYVLKASPNHHRALIAMTRLGARVKSDQPVGADFTIPCYYDRAIRYAPDDIIVRALFAQYLSKRGLIADGLRQLDSARESAAEDGFSHYNIGLVYFELGAYDAALGEAWRAQALGFEQPELAAMLKKNNKWRNPPTPDSSASAPTSAPVTADTTSR